MSHSVNKVVLAYSGGLDTSVILGWLQDEGWDVHCVYVDLGQPCEDRDAIMKKAEDNGAKSSRLIDVTGDPYDEANVAKDDFEKFAIAQLKAGNAYVDRVEMTDGKPVLRAATAVPVVLPKCIACHAHYENVKKGSAIGALIYTVPVE